MLVFLLLFWDQKTVIIQLSGFYCNMEAYGGPHIEDSSLTGARSPLPDEFGGVQSFVGLIGATLVVSRSMPHSLLRHVR